MVRNSREGARRGEGMNGKSLNRAPPLYPFKGEEGDRDLEGAQRKKIPKIVLG